MIERTKLGRIKSCSFTEDEIQTMCKRYISGENYERIASSHNVSGEVIRKLLIKNDVKIRSSKYARKTFSEDTERSICDRYSNFETIDSIAKSFNLSSAPIRYVLKKYDVVLRVGSPFSKEVTDKACAMYEEGKTQKEVGILLGINPVAVHRMLKRSKIQARSLSDYRQYTVNEHAFDILTEESAYWLGFLITDGCVTHSTDQVVRKLKIKIRIGDIQHLEKLKTFLHSTHPIYIYKPGRFGGELCSLEISSKELCDKLAEYNVIPRKSLTTKAPDCLVTNPNFWRGVVDGNGWLGVNAKGPFLGLCGGNEIVDQFHEYAKSLTSVKATVVRRVPNKNTVKYTIKKVVDIVNVIYKNSTIYLDRKMEKANMIFAYADARYTTCQ